MRSIRHLPPLLSLRAFEAAARHLSFSRAAQELFVTQSAVSPQVQKLEADLGIALFECQTRTIELTRKGRESASAPAANYVPFMQEGDLLYISGQISRHNGQPAYLGRLGDNIGDDEGAQAARQSAIGVGENGRHARSAVGVASLPAGVVVEVEAVIALKNT